VLQIGGGVIQVDIRIGQGSLRNEDTVAWLHRATEAMRVILIGSVVRSSMPVEQTYKRKTMHH
jgi:hypothetical protein